MKLGTCIHYVGLTYGQGTCKCGAGVDLRATFGNDRPGISLRMPCIEYRMVPVNGRGTYCKPGDREVREEIDRRGEIAIPCALRVEPTAAQSLHSKIKFEAAFQNTLAGIKVASTWRVKPKPDHDRSEVIECPVCKGRLHLSQSSLNGHCHGKCETEGCVAWME